MSPPVPESYNKLVVNKLTADFRKAVNIVATPTPKLKENEVLIRNKFVGVNAADVNITAGRYFSDGKTPFDIGFEGIGHVIAVGNNVKTVKVGQNVAYLDQKSYSEYVSVSEDKVFPIPKLIPEYAALLVSGLTAAIGLDKSARITEGETVLITAAAGGCGHIAVQWAKAAGCHVIGTCSSKKKAEVLKDLGCDTVINYKKEDLDEVLQKEYPKGIDVIWETIGGKVFDVCVKHLAVKGRLIVVGSITGYISGTKSVSASDLSALPMQLLFNSAAVQGFFILHYAECFPTYFNYLRDMFSEGKIKIILDKGLEANKSEFTGLDGISDAVEFLHSGQSIGKVIVKIS